MDEPDRCFAPPGTPYRDETTIIELDDVNKYSSIQPVVSTKYNYCYIFQTTNPNNICVKYPALDGMCITIMIICLIGLAIFCIGSIYYGINYAIYHTQYDMSTGCPLNKPNCTKKLVCYEQNLLGCFRASVLSFVVIIVGIMYAYLFGVMYIYLISDK